MHRKDQTQVQQEGNKSLPLLGQELKRVSHSGAAGKEQVPSQLGQELNCVLTSLIGWLS